MVCIGTLHFHSFQIQFEYLIPECSLSVLSILKAPECFRVFSCWWGKVFFREMIGPLLESPYRRRKWLLETSIAGKPFEICWVNPDSFSNACIWNCGKLLQWFIQFISPVELGDIKLGRLGLSTIIHSTFFTLITWDFFSSCWVGWEFSDLLSWGVMNFQFSMTDILLQSLTLKKRRVYVLCEQMFSIISLFASVICPGLPFRTQARSFLSKLLVSVQMPMMVLWA